MSRKYHTLRLGDDQYRLRLTIRGQNNLRERFQEDTIQTVLGAATDSRRMVALLEEALNWEGNENPVTMGNGSMTCWWIRATAVRFNSAGWPLTLPPVPDW